MTVLNGIAGALFDLDDTLLDWSHAAGQGVRAAVAAHIVPAGVGAATALAVYEDVMEENQRRLAATGAWWNTRQRLERMAARLPRPVPAPAIVRTFYDTVQHAIRPLPGAAEALRACQEAGLKVGLLTNGPAHIQRPKLAGLPDAFDAVAISGETGLWKPDPRAFRRLLDRLGLAPQRAAMVGDHLQFDIAPARALGMRTAWVVRDEAARRAGHPAADLVVAGPHALVPHFAGLSHNA